MRFPQISALLALTLVCQLQLSAQRYSNVIDQALNAADLMYMPAEELKILKNEIIAIKGARSQVKGNTQSKNPYVQYSCTQQFLSEMDQANLDLINAALQENHQKTCSEEDLYKLFIQLAQSKQQMPLYIAKKYYGLSLDRDMIEHQKVLKISDDLMAFWVPQFSTCEDCPYQNHFVTINNKGERSASLIAEGIMTVLENNILEIKAVKNSPASTTTQPEYYQIMADGQLNFTGNQMVRADSK